MDMHDLSFKRGVRNIDVWKEQDCLAGAALGDGCMTDDVSISQLRVCLEGARAEKWELIQKKSRIHLAHLGHIFSSMGRMKLEKWGASPLRAALLCPKLCLCNSCHVNSCTMCDWARCVPMITPVNLICYFQTLSRNVAVRYGFFLFSPISTTT